MKSLVALVATVLFIGTLLFVSIQSNYNSLKEIENSEIQLDKNSFYAFNLVEYEKENGFIGVNGSYLGKVSYDGSELKYENILNKKIFYWVAKDKNNNVYKIESEKFECNIEELNLLIDSLNNRYSIELENFVLPEKPDMFNENISSVSDINDNRISVTGNYWYSSNNCEIRISFFDRQLYLKHRDWENRKNK